MECVFHLVCLRWWWRANCDRFLTMNSFGTRLWQMCVRHAGALVLACVFGLLMVYPFIQYQHDLGTAYQGIQRPIQDDELFYLSVIREAMDGRPDVRNPYFWEQRNVLPQQVFLGEYLLAQPLLWFHLDVVEGRLMYNVVLPFVSCLLTYAIAYVISRSRLQAILSTMLLLFGLFTFVFLRPVSPQLNFVFWLTEFLLLYLFATRPTSLVLTGASAVNLGALFYLYPYYWTQDAALVAILALLLWREHRRKALHALAILGGAGIVASYYVYTTMRAAHESGYLETLTRIGTIFSHAPGAVKIFALSAVLLTVIVVLVKRRRLSIGPEFFFFVAVIVSGMVASNQQVVSGRIFQFSLHYQMQIVFGALFCCLYLVREGVVGAATRRTFACLAVCALLAFGLSDGHGLWAYVEKIRTIPVDDRWIQRYAPAFAWMRAHAATDDVVYANRLASELLPVYTQTKVFFADAASVLTISDQAYEDRYILNHYVDSFTPEYIRTNQRSLFCVRYLNRASQKRQQDLLRHALRLSTTTESLVPDAAVAQIQERARMLQSQRLEDGLARYRVDYVLWDKARDPHWSFDDRPAFTKVFENAETAIYHVSLSSPSV